MSKKRCPLGFNMSHHKSCYMVVAERATWVQARAACREHRGDLLGIETETENSYKHGQLNSGRGMFSNFLSRAETAIAATATAYSGISRSNSTQELLHTRSNRCSRRISSWSSRSSIYSSRIIIRLKVKRGESVKAGAVEAAWAATGATAEA